MLWLGQTISSLGNGAFYTAIAWQVLQLTGSATAMGLVLVAESVPRVVFLLLGGVVADRLPRRLVMLWSDAARAVAVLLLAVLGWLGVLLLWHVLVAALAFGLAEAFFIPAYQSLPPQLVPEEHLPSANALISLSRSGSMLVGPALGALLVSAVQPAGAFAFDGLTFLASAAFLLALRLPPQAATTPSAQGASGGARRMLADLRAGLGYVTASPWLWVTIAVAGLGNVALAPFQVATPKLVESVFRADVWLLGAIFSANAAGDIGATLVLGHVHHLRHRGLLAYGGLLLAGAAFFSLGLPWTHTVAPVAAIAAGATFGIGLGVFQLIWVTTLQQLVPQEMLGRVSSIDWVGSLCLMPVGLAIAGVLTDRMGPSWVFLAGGLLSLALNGLALSVRGIRELD